MLKTKFLVVFFLAIAIVFCFSITFAKNDKNSDIPEENGTYDVPGHPEMKVRVFVHNIKPGKPVPPAPTLQCKLDDLDSQAVVDSAGWKLPNSWTYNLNPYSVPSSVDGKNLATIADNSFSVWTAAIHNKINISKGTDTPITQKGYDGKNIITWGMAPGSALAITYIWYNPITQEVKEVDTIMNQKFFWMWSGLATCAYTNSYDAQSILTHELGHWFGLDDEYTLAYVNNTMYGYGSKGDAKADTLTTGDIDGAKDIYNSFK